MKNLICKLFVVFISLSALGQNEINPNGFNRIFYPNGSLQSEGLMKNGEPDGYWKNYYPTGIKKSEGRRKNSQLDSIWVFYNLVGDTINKISYLNGKKNGYSYNYFTENFLISDTRKFSSRELYVNDEKEGKSFYYYKNGSVNFETEYSKNKKEGVEIEYDELGKIITISRYRKGIITDQEKINRVDKDGLKIGVWKTFYDGIRVKTESNFRNNELDGYYKEYDINGKLMLTLLYREGRLIETVKEDNIISEEKTEYYSDGIIKSQGLFKKGKAVGLHKTFSKEGKEIIAEIFNDDGILISKGVIDEEGFKTGLWQEFYSYGKLSQKGKYKANKRDGEWVFYNTNGTIEQSGNFKDGFYSDEWTWYYPNGNLWKKEEYLNGLLDGKYTEYDMAGNIIVSGEYLEGDSEGEWITLINDNKAVGKYVSGLLDGKWKSFYDNGNIAFEGNFVQGNPDGKQKYYYPDGTLKEEQIYNQGVRENNWKKYNEEGDLVLTITYKNDKEFRINGVKIDFPTETVKLIK